MKKIRQEIKRRLYGLLHRRGGVWEINDGYSYQSLFTTDREEAERQLEYLYENCKINKDIYNRIIAQIFEEKYCNGEEIPKELWLARKLMIKR